MKVVLVHGMVKRRSWRRWLMILGSSLVSTQFIFGAESVNTRKIIERKLLEFSADLSVLMAIER